MVLARFTAVVSFIDKLMLQSPPEYAIENTINQLFTMDWIIGLGMFIERKQGTQLPVEIIFNPTNIAYIFSSAMTTMWGFCDTKMITNQYEGK